MRGLRGRTALVTGAAQGIGEAIARRLAQEGMKVALADVNRDAVTATAETIAAETGERTIAIVGDVSVESNVAQIVASCVSAFGELHALVNNAGVDLISSPDEITREKWERVHGTDLWGIMLMVRETIEWLSKDGGAIVNIASTHANATVEGRSVYAAAKAGALGLSRGLAIDLGPRGIRVNTVLPGYVRTPIWKLWLEAAPDPEKLLSRIAARHPSRRIGMPADVAGVVAFLCSEDAAFITGSNLVVDGGYTALLESPLE